MTKNLHSTKHKRTLQTMETAHVQKRLLGYIAFGIGAIAFIVSIIVGIIFALPWLIIIGGVIWIVGDLIARFDGDLL
jgi:predicted membrane channel-forming protein YqfA (hemolysin III family)